MTEAAIETINSALSAYTRADATGSVEDQIHAYNRLCDACFSNGCPVDIAEPAEWASFHVMKWLVAA